MRVAVYSRGRSTGWAACETQRDKRWRWRRRRRRLDRVVGKGQRGLYLVSAVCRGGAKRKGVVSRLVQGQTYWRVAGGWRKAKGVALTSGWRNAGATPLVSSRISALRLTLTLLEHRSVLERGESRGCRGSPRPFHRRCSIGGHRSDLPPRFY